MRKKIDLFLSHNGADKAWTEKLAFDIENNTDGFPLSVFFDKWDISPGSSIPQELDSALTNCRFLGFVMSPESLKSDWVTLEHSSILMRDPAANQNTIIPILRRKCEIPTIFKRLNYIDFTNDSKYYESLEILLSVLRNKPIKRGEKKSFDIVYLQEDQILLQKYLKVFQRPAFRTTCVMELFLEELLEAIDDTQAAINTGTLYSRNGNLLAEIPEFNHFNTTEFKNSFKNILSYLSKLKRIVLEFNNDFKRSFSEYSQDRHHNFYSIFVDWSFEMIKKSKFDLLKSVIKKLDEIDSLRNNIIITINQLLDDSNMKLDNIELSSKIIFRQNIGGLGGINFE